MPHGHYYKGGNRIYTPNVTYIPASIRTIGYVRCYTVVAYALCVIITLDQYAYGTIL